MAVFVTAPALSRAIAECTQASGPSGNSIRADGHAAPASAAAFVLQGYLADPRTVDVVYQGLMQRAWAQPISVGIVERVIAIVRQHIVTHTPSPALLQQLQRFCDKIPKAVALSAASLRSLHYVQSMLNKWLGASAVTSVGPPPSVSAGDGQAQRQGSQPLAPRPQAGGLEQRSPEHALAPTAPCSNWALLLPETSGFVAAEAVAAAAGPAGAAAAVSVSTLLQGALGLDSTRVSRQLSEVVESMQVEATASAAALSPGATSASATGAAYMQRQAANGGSATLAAAMGSAVGRSSVPGASRQLFQHLPYCRQEELAGGAGLGGGGGGSTFSAASSSAIVSGEDVALVIEVVLGPAAAGGVGPAPRSTPTLDGSVGHGAESGGREDAEGKGPNQPQEEVVGGYWESQFDVDGFGQVCSGILIKLIMDLYLRAGSTTSYPLVLRMLYRALSHRRASPAAATPPPGMADAGGSALAAVTGAGAGGAGRRAAVPVQVPAWRSRARVFDLLYNLGLHAPLLYSTASGEASDAAAAGRGGDGDGGGGGVKGSEAGVERFRAWLRALLFPLLVQLRQGGEQQEGVWAAALTCLLHLTTHGGVFADAAVRHLPTQAALGLLRACMDFGWSQELYCHLLHLYCRVCQQAAAGGPGQDGQLVGGASDKEAIMQELVEQLAHAPTSAARQDVLAALVCQVANTGGEAEALTTFCAALGAEAVAAALQVAARSPLTDMAGRLQQALAKADTDADADAGAGLKKDRPQGQLLLERLLARVQAVAQESAERGVESVDQTLKLTLSSITSQDATPARGSTTTALQQAWQQLKDLACDTDAAAQKLATHWLHLVLRAAMAACQPNLLALSPLNLKSTPSESWKPLMADLLLHLVRVAPAGSTTLLQATLRAAADLQCASLGFPPASATPSTTLSSRAEPQEQGGGGDRQASMLGSAMQALYVVLLWLLQSGDSQQARARSQPAIDTLADRVLELCSCPLALTSSPQRPSPLPPAGALLAGHWGLSPGVVQATPPELLVLLLQQTSPSGRAAGSQCFPCTAPRLAFVSFRPASLLEGSNLQGSSLGGAAEGDAAKDPLAGVNSVDSVDGVGGVCIAGDPAAERRAALLLVLLARCGTDADAFAKHSLAHVLKEQLEQGGPRERFLAGTYLLQHWAQNQPHKHWRLMRELVVQAAHADEEKLLHNPYFKIRAMMACQEGTGIA